MAQNGHYSYRGSLPRPEPPLGDGVVALRPWEPTPSDAAALVGAWTDPEIARWTGVPAGPSVAVAASWIDGQAARQASGLALDLVVTGFPPGSGATERSELVRSVWGEVGLAHFDPARRVAEVGFWTAPRWRGRGVASRSTDLLAGWALRPPLRLVGVFARTHPGNRAAASALRRSGFELLGQAGPSSSDVWLRSARAQKATDLGADDHRQAVTGKGGRSGG